MDRVMVFLRTSLYSYGGRDAHIPPGVMVVEGSLVHENQGSIRVDADRFLDERGRELLDEAMTMTIPWGKIDHVLIVV